MYYLHVISVFKMKHTNDYRHIYSFEIPIFRTRCFVPTTDFLVDGLHQCHDIMPRKVLSDFITFSPKNTFFLCSFFCLYVLLNRAVLLLPAFLNFFPSQFSSHILLLAHFILHWIHIAILQSYPSSTARGSEAAYSIVSNGIVSLSKYYIR